ncbi:MAG: hypothetical protein COB59_10140 [Rhodospirillaceae bacterium]|nr:MAG: hypothetical protein COB59_10140 [Rhodospirillaceae bacterium]
MSGILSSAVSGLNYNSQRVSASADNIANSSTPNYKRVDIQSTSISTPQTSSTLYAPGGVLGSTRQLSGVDVSMDISIGALNNNVDIGAEFVNLIQAETAYGAGLKVIQAGEEMANSLLDIKA